MMVPGTDPMFHRHLVAAYAAVWIIQLGYLAYVGKKWFTVRRAENAAKKKTEASE
jgi:hypothetical protein